MSNSNRRVFLMQVAACGSVFAATAAQAQALDEKDPQAVALGYVSDAKKADAKKFPKYAADQKCGNCGLFQGGAAATGGCPLFGTKQVAATGWCSAWVKKP